MSAPTLLAAIFWTAVAMTVYSYVLFPGLAVLLGKRRVRKLDSGGDPSETVTVVIPAYNEDRNIETKIRNVLAANYPRSSLDVIVVSDASTDRTNEIVARFDSDGVRLLVQPERRGKTAGLNRAVELARGELVVFTDANAVYPPDTLRALVRYFRCAQVGLVTGYTKYRTGESGNVAEVTNCYTSLERVIKRAESRWGCCVGADGAVFAMRRSLYRFLREDDINDFVLPLGVVDQGFQCVFADDVFCTENTAKDLEGEFRRQSRITNRTLRALWRNLHLLNPFRFPLFSFFLFSHKLVRFLVPILLMVSTMCLPFLIDRGATYMAAALCALISLGVVAIVKSIPRLARTGSALGRPLFVLNAFLTINLAVLNGWRRFLSGDSEATWQHDRTVA